MSVGTKKQFDYKAFNALKKTPKYWGFFDHSNSKHRYILSLLHQLGWVTVCPKSGRNRPDGERLGEWLQSTKSPVNKPLKKMDGQTELPKIIKALEQMIKKKYK